MSYVQESCKTNTSSTVKLEAGVGEKHAGRSKNSPLKQLRNFYAENL